MTKTCLTCTAEMERRPKEDDMKWAARKYCSTECARQSRKRWVGRAAALAPATGGHERGELERYAERNPIR